MRIGILGGGQLGRMLALAGYPLGITCVCIDGDPDASAGTVAELVTAEPSDTKRMEAWASRCDILTYEWENFPPELVAHLSDQRPLFPNVKSLATGQDRWHEKVLFDELDIPVAPFRFVNDEDELRTAVDEIGVPLVVKTRTGGYDGKGQAVVHSADDLHEAVALLKHGPLIAEQRISFTKEVSAIGVRSKQGEFLAYPVTENLHQHGILHTSIVPAGVPAELEADAHSYVEAIMKKLDYVGVLALEMFVTKSGLLANEIAPRVHNSGHWTINGAETSQFENHLRAIAGMPLGSTAMICPTAMVNCIGTTPPLVKVLEIPGTHVHLYNKSDRPGRKVAHINVTASTSQELRDRLWKVEKLVL